MKFIYLEVNTAKPNKTLILSPTEMRYLNTHHVYYRTVMFITEKNFGLYIYLPYFFFIENKL